MSTISAVVITKNEEHNIVACLNTLRWVDEIIVVDAESDDRTVELALPFARQVLVLPWKGFGPQKNLGIEQARSDWVLIVDADERVTDELRWEIHALLREPFASAPVGYRIPRKNYFYHCWIRSGGMYPDYQVRLFKRCAGRYDETLLHENLILRGEIGTLHGHLEHHTIPTLAGHMRKMMHYTSLAARQKLKQASAISAQQIAFHHVGTIVKTYLLRGGWRDGIPGIIVAGFAGLHTFVKYVKAYESTLTRRSREDDGIRPDVSRHDDRSRSKHFRTDRFGTGSGVA